MFTNRHVIIAMIVAPVLAIMAWFAIGELVVESAAPAQPGMSYPLVPRSNCRYASGLCDLENEDLRLSLRFDTSLGPAMELRSSHALDSVLLAVSQADAQATPQAMLAQDGAGRLWRLQLSGQPGVDDQVQLVAAAAGSRYFAETTTDFLQSEE